MLNASQRFLLAVLKTFMAMILRSILNFREIFDLLDDYHLETRIRKAHKSMAYDK